MTGGILYHERLNFVARGPALLAVALIAVAIVYAGWSGDGWRDARVGSLEAFEVEKTEALMSWREDLLAVVRRFAPRAGGAAGEPATAGKHLFDRRSARVVVRAEPRDPHPVADGHRPLLVGALFEQLAP